MACVARAYLSVPLLRKPLAKRFEVEGGQGKGGAGGGRERKEEQIETRDKNRLMMQ